MSSIKSALERLDRAVGKLDASSTSVELLALENQNSTEGNIIDIDFMAKRLDSAINTVEDILSEKD